MIITNVNQVTIDLIKQFESLHDGDLSAIGLQPKQCPVGIWTVGYGHALRNNCGQFLIGSKDKDEAYRQYACLEEPGACALLANDLEIFARFVLKRIVLPVTDNQFGAMVSLCYNIGMTAFKNSTVLRRYNEGNYAEAAEAFALWIKGKDQHGRKVVLPGLVKRRLAEVTLFLTP